ncbi:MAG: DUF3054 domain-containing protein [Propionibacteriaceae bacterium]
MVTTMRPWTKTLLDLVLVLVFAIIGRASHDEGPTPLGVLTTGWPFLVAGAIGSVLACLVLRLGWLKEGVIVWSTTAVVGLLLRAVTGGGVAVAFMIVATTTLGILLVGWRFVVSRRPAGRQSMVTPGGRGPV